MPKPLNQKHFRFCEFIVEGLSQTEAYAKAFDRPGVGKYEQKRGCELSKNPRIKEIIKKRRDGLQITTNVTAQGIIQKMWEIATSLYTQDSAKVSALAWLGKYHGLWADSTKDGGAAQFTLTINNYGIVSKEERKILERLPGERHSALQLPATAVPTSRVDRLGQRSEENR